MELSRTSLGDIDLILVNESSIIEVVSTHPSSISILLNEGKMF